MGKEFVETLCKKEPIESVFKLLKENISQSYILTGSPNFIVQKYLKEKGIDIPEDKIFAGVYNGSGEKEKLLEKWKTEFDIIYIDDDAALVRNASIIVKEVYLVKQEYNKDSWKEFNTL